jgi:hypothetical protein
MSFAFGRPSCELALRYVWAPNLRTCLALRWGAQLADVRTCLAFVLRTYLVLRLERPTCGCALLCVGATNLGEAILKSLPPSQNLFLSIQNSGFPKLGRGKNRPSAGKIRGFRSWATGETAQVRGKFGVFEAGPREKPPKCGKNSGFLKLGRGRYRPSAGKIQGFRSWAVGETAQVWGKFGVSEAGPREKPPKCGENSGFPKLGRGRNCPSAGKIRGF